MREIKFRAWCRNMQEMIEVTDLHISENNPWVKNSSGGFTKNFNLLQYTGLHDKNGKEIYEGDILAGRNLIYKVLWDESWGWRAWYEDGSKSGNDGALWIVLDRAEIIGNLHENPELLDRG